MLTTALSHAGGSQQLRYCASLAECRRCVVLANIFCMDGPVGPRALCSRTAAIVLTIAGWDGHAAA